MALPLTASNLPKILGKAITASELRDAVFSEDYPESEVTVPTIAWKIRHIIPGKEGKETKKARYRKVDESDPTKIYWGQWTTIIYQFDLFHASNQEVNMLVEKFKRFILEAGPALGRAGVDVFIFDEQAEDPDVKPPKDSRVRTLRYMASFTEVTVLRVPTIRDIIASLYTDMIPYHITMSRSSADYDLLPEYEDDGTTQLKIAEVVHIRDDQLYEPNSDPDYVNDVDYQVVTRDDGRMLLVWKTGGKEPEAGATYYVTVFKSARFIEESMLRTAANVL